MNLLNFVFKKFLTIRFPELEHLPTTEREKILRRCLERQEVRVMNGRVRYAAFIPVAVSFALLLIGIQKHWALPLILGSYFCALLTGIIALFVSAYALKSRLLHRLVHEELRKPKT